MKHFTLLLAWKTGIELVQEIYRLTSTFPREEIYGLSSQLKKSSTSIVANLAEGCGRFTYADKAAKFVIARGECTETEAHLLIAKAVNILTQADIRKALELIETERKLLSGLITASKSH